MSREFGVDLVKVYNDSVNCTKFKNFLGELRNKFWSDDIIIVMDNLAVHRNREVKERMDELGFKYTYTPVASPMYNGTEEVINLGKINVKKKRLDAIIKDERIDMDRLIL